ncbi:MAG: S41 family peptidase, partial [Motiliproteus sp.]|nr:S41 family peptidase [Motiliproteus sp.]
RALKLTTARYYTPNGRSIQAEGIIPDIVVEPSKVTKVEKRAGGLVKEADLKGHLSNGSDEGKSKAKEKDGKNDKILSRDYQLNEALNLLKGIVIYQRADAAGS